MKRVALQNGAAGRHMVPISAPRNPKVPKSIRVPDGISRRQYDSLENFITGLGTGKDKQTYTHYTLVMMNRAQQEFAYRGDWIARKIVTIPAEDATREWRSWQSDDKDIEAIELLERNLNLQQKTFTAIWKARLYGGAGLLLGVDQGDLSEELNPDAVQKGALKFVHVVTRWDLANGPIIWDVDSPYYGQPEYYTRAVRGVEKNPRINDRIHPSRIVRFIGNEIPDLNLAAGEWGDSVLQSINDAIIAAGTSTAAGAQLLNELKLDIIKVPDLTASISNKKYEQRLTARFAMANVAKSMYNTLLLDGNEEWQRIDAQLTGLPDTLKMYLLIASGAADIPATRFLGQSPAGLSATGESDIRNYYDKIKSIQSTVVTPAMDRLDKVLIRSAVGDVKEGDVVYVWRPLWQMDDAQKAEVASKKANTYKVDVDAAQIPANVIRDARINQLIEDGTYPGLEQILDDYGDLDDLEEEPETPPGFIVGPNGELMPDPNAPPANANDPRLEPEQAVGDMARRIRDALSNKKKTKPRRKKVQVKDATPQTLYVRRDVVNKDELLTWARNVGLDKFGELTEDLHVTIMYSRTPVDWGKAGEDWNSTPNGELVIKPGGMRMLDRLGVGGSVVGLLFTSEQLAWRHISIKNNLECSWDWDYFQPHITFVYGNENVTIDPDELRMVEPYRGEIVFGPEIWEPTKTEGKYK
jgi:hypothetical protein